MNRLREGASVTVNLPQGSAPARLADFECTVLAVEGSRAVLQPVHPLPDAIPGRFDRVLLAFEHGASLVGLKGVLTRHGAAVVFAVSDGVEVPRRRVPRYDARIPFEARNVRTGDGDAGVTRDVSVDGALLETALAAATGDRLALSLALPSGDPVLLMSVVVREASGLLAVSYAGPQAASRAPLAAFVATLAEAAVS